MQVKLSDPIESLKGIGPARVSVLKKKNILTVSDLLFYFPRRYQDYSQIIPVAKLKPGQVTIKAKINNARTRYARRGIVLTEAIASDTTDSVRIIWFNQPYRQKSLIADQEYYISGQYKLSRSRYSLTNPVIEPVGAMMLNSARIVPVYPESKNLTSLVLRKAVAAALDYVPLIKETLPPDIVDELNLMPLSSAVKAIHFPENQAELDTAIKRFNFDELFPLLLANELNKRDLSTTSALEVRFNQQLAKKFVSQLPFELSDDQRRVIWRIYLDMQQPVPMNRLVEGDVGSGKTVVAVMAAVMALAEGFKVAYLAPTELLAKQQYETIVRLLKPLSLSENAVFLSGSLNKKEKQQALKTINLLSSAFIIGTHSLLYSDVNWSNLALLIVDEQHRFGVDQRMELKKHSQHLPHFLSLTATPIPRSLALTALSDLSLSRLVTMPSGRQPIDTSLVAPSSFDSFLKNLKNEINNGRQAYIVCPYINPAPDQDKKISVLETYAEYSRLLPKLKIGLVHGQMSGDDQESVMRKFYLNEINILVATSVIEVGLDVPNASVMAVYGPERFGLAQLHQLRGRVGRGKHKSYCHLILSDASDPNIRLRSFAQISDGFRLSELDLKIRGPGAVYGKLQHGKTGMNWLLLDDQHTIRLCRQAIEIVLSKKLDLLKYKDLAQQVKDAQSLTYLN